MNPAIRSTVTIPCSKCGDTLRVYPHELEEGKELKCPRCDQFFIPSKILIDMVSRMARNNAENGE
jgi:DNA-directed RNA polymerase subunit RPC12/RpoP